MDKKKNHILLHVIHINCTIPHYGDAFTPLIYTTSSLLKTLQFIFPLLHYVVLIILIVTRQNSIQH